MAVEVEFVCIGMAGEFENLGMALDSVNFERSGMTVDFDSTCTAAESSEFELTDLVVKFEHPGWADEYAGSSAPA